MATDSLSFTSALSVALAVVFLVITIGISLYKLIDGSVEMPRLLPEIVDISSFLKLFTAVPVVVTAYVCHYNGNAHCSLFLLGFQFQAYFLASLFSWWNRRLRILLDDLA